MSPLKFICCGWEPSDGGDGSFKKTENDIHYTITMYAEAFDADDELTRDRSKIQYFYVIATIVEI